jgi:hypothetical protein
MTTWHTPMLPDLPPLPPPSPAHAAQAARLLGERGEQRIAWSVRAGETLTPWGARVLLAAAELWPSVRQILEGPTLQ